MRVEGDPPRFSPDQIQVRPGQTVEITVMNNDPFGRSHNWVLVKPGTLGAVIDEGIEAGQDDGGVEYDPDVLANSLNLPAGGRENIAFLAPTRTGDYPFVSTLNDEESQVRGTLRIRAR